MNKNSAPQTAAVHNHEVHDTISNGVNMPIFASSAFKYEKGTTNRYPRYYNSENERSLIAKLSALEHTENGFLMSSGMAAISTALLGLLQPGDHALFQEQLYGGTLHLLHHELKRLGIGYSLVKGGSVADFQAAMQPNTKLLYLETPSNPLLQVLDLKALGKWANEQKLLSLIDNTFASPVNQNPADFGIDVILHSGTKYLGGHSDLCFGALLTSNELRERLFPTAIALGGSLNPMDLYLIDRSLKTLYVRVAQQNKNAQALAEWLLEQEQVAKVNYPGLPSHPQHHIAQQQMRGFGGMLSFQLATDAPAEMAQFLKKLTLIVPAISLGGVETICSVPADTSHNKISAEARAEAGISDFLVRLSVGVEAIDDLKNDLKAGTCCCTTRSRCSTMSQLPSILKEILTVKATEVAKAKQQRPVESFKDETNFARSTQSFTDALKQGSGIIAEFKRKSPSKGFFNADADAANIATQYAMNGASAISVLTDHQFFGGQLTDLQQVREAVELPLLRKDFIIDSYQIAEAKAAGADVILLIAACLSVEQLNELTAAAHEHKLQVLLEVHSMSELEAAAAVKADAFGVNNRDLHTFTTSLTTSEQLAAHIPTEAVKVAESGISNPQHVRQLRLLGYQGFLIGEHFMLHQEPGEALHTFIQQVK